MGKGQEPRPDRHPPVASACRAQEQAHAADGGFVFVRWTTCGTGLDGPIEGIGTDRFRLRGGLVAESLIMSDLPVFGHLARRVAGRG